MGNRKARNTGVLGTCVEAIGDEGKMISGTGQRLYEAMVEAKTLARQLAEAEARGYRRGVEDAAEATEEYEIDWRCGPFENRLYIKRAILALLEQTGHTNSPHPENGTGLKSET
jgi:hypothetical protein